MNNNIVTDQIGDIRLFNGNCMDWMKDVPDDYYDLAIIDPPYGIKEDGLKNHSRCKLAQTRKYTPKEWDNNSPDVNFFNELIRVSKNQIIWGANHFISKIPYDSSCWIVWDKDNGNTDFADCELAWTSFKTSVRRFKFKWQGMLQEDMKNKQERIHPTEKPIKLYEWLLRNYAKQGDKIFDSHFGSLSIGIACHNLGFGLDACELDKEYYQKALERLKSHQAQGMLFIPTEEESKPKIEQLNIF